MSLDDELAAVAARFGADRVQVERDHLISHVLAALGGIDTDALTFFGGTALSRTFLPDGRLSEDIDLLARGGRADVARAVTEVLARSLLRTHGRPTWTPRLVDAGGSRAALLAVPTGATIRVQLLDGTGYPWPTEVRVIEQRYSDAAPTRLRTLTAPAFAAAKLAAWIDRGASRDLWDLARLAAEGKVDREAADLFRRYGPFGSAPGPWVFATPPDAARWRTDLAHQTVLDLDARAAMDTVRAAWDRAFAG